MTDDIRPHPGQPFMRYSRTVMQTKDIAEVTPENIGQIASLIGGLVDYSGAQPVLVVPAAHDDGFTAEWRVKVGWHVSLLGNRLVNQNGFNRDGTWTCASSADLPAPSEVPQ